MITRHPHILPKKKFTTYQRFVANTSAISPFLGGSIDRALRQQSPAGNRALLHKIWDIVWVVVTVKMWSSWFFLNPVGFVRNSQKISDIVWVAVLFLSRVHAKGISRTLRHTLQHTLQYTLQYTLQHALQHCTHKALAPKRHTNSTVGFTQTHHRNCTNTLSRFYVETKNV